MLRTCELVDQISNRSVCFVDIFAINLATGVFSLLKSIWKTTGNHSNEARRGENGRKRSMNKKNG